MTQQPKQYLIQNLPKKGIARIFIRTAALAERADMRPYDGPVPKSMQITLGEAAKAEKAVPYKTAMDGNATYPPNTPSHPVALPGTAMPPVQGVQGAPPAGTGVSGAEGKELNPENPDAGKPGEGDPDGGEKAQSLIPKLSPAEKASKLFEICSRLEQNDKNFTVAGIPRIDTLILMLDGVDVSTPERDAAWAAVLASRSAK